MALRKEECRNDFGQKTPLDSSGEELWKRLVLCLLIVMFLFVLASLTYNAADTSFNASGSSEITNLLGSVGAIVADTSLQGFGLANIAVIVALGGGAFGWFLNEQFTT